MTRQMTALRERLAELEDLRLAAGLLSWDQQTMMPARGAPQRAEALATLERISHDHFVAAQTGTLLEGAAAELNGGDPDSDDACLVRLVRRRWEKARRVPTELAAELARAASVGQDAWIAARGAEDFDAFAPYLEKNIELVQRYVECFDDFDCAYDALLDDYEPQMSAAHVAQLFTELKDELVPLIATVSQLGCDSSVLTGDFPVDGQRRLVSEILGMMGFDSAGWRLDTAVHPFATSFGATDVRITTRWDQTFLPTALFGAMHECGHGLYEAGIAEGLQRTALGHGESLGMHESQSRLWENMVGRGRAFTGVLAPRIANVFGGRLANLDHETLYRAVNCVNPSFIRVEADEATYGLHIVLRFELEQDLLEGRLAVRDVPEAWNALTREYLGLTVNRPSEGALQDVHWSAGLIGYFPTYALGNMIAGQLWQQVHVDVPDIEAQIAAGELSGLRSWLREKVHQHGSKFRTAELLQRVVGAPIEVGPFTSYLKQKLGEVYGVPLA
jgi:carboxypeptidase Taq